MLRRLTESYQRYPTYNAPRTTGPLTTSSFQWAGQEVQPCLEMPSFDFCILYWRKKPAHSSLHFVGISFFRSVSSDSKSNCHLEILRRYTKTQVMSITAKGSNRWIKNSFIFNLSLKRNNDPRAVPEELSFITTGLIEIFLVCKAQIIRIQAKHIEFLSKRL